MKKRVSIIALALILVLSFVALVACDNAQMYKINIQEAVGGKVTADCAEAKAGTTITLTVQADAGYIVSSVKANGKELSVDGGKATFVMPEEDVAVVAEFLKADYTVTIDTNIVRGKVKASAAGGNVGDVITLTVTPDYGYKLASLKAGDEDVAATEPGGDYKFAMPASNVVVTATFTLADNVDTTAAPQNGIKLSEEAELGGTAEAVMAISYEDEAIKVVAYVEDDAITQLDGVGVYFGTNDYAQAKLTASNKGVVVTHGGVSVYGVSEGEYVAIDTTVQTTLAPWAVDGAVCGYVVTISVPYTVLGTTKDAAEGKTTAIFTLTNCDIGTYSSEAVYNDCDINNANTYYVVESDGALTQNYYRYGVGQLGQGSTPIATGNKWDLSADYAVDDENYADRKAVLNGHDEADNNLAMYRATGKNIYATATFTLTGMGNTSERWGKFGIMLFNGASQKGLLFYVDAFIGDSGDVKLDNINGTALGYNSAANGWGSWTGLSGTNGAFNLETKSITLGLTAYDGMVYMYHGDKLVGETSFDLGDNAVMGFKSFGYNMEVTNYYATSDLNDEQFKAHRKEIVNQTIDTLFLGDSYMDFWRNSGFNTHTAAIETKANIGVGGTKIDYWTERVGFIKKMYTPSNFVFHIGVNDIDDGNTTAEKAFESIQAMFEAYQTAFPDANIYWVSLVHNTMFANKAGEYDKMNAAVKAYAQENDNIHYIDVSSAGMDADGNPRENMMYDGLHFNYEYGYPIWGKLIMEALGYADERTQGTTLGDIGDIYAYNVWTFSEDGTVASSNAIGEQAIWAKDMEYASNFLFTVDVKSTSVLNGDAWSKVGLVLRNDNLSIFGYVDLPSGTPAANRKFCNIVYRPNVSRHAGDWLWALQGSGSEAEKLIESDYVTLGIAKIGGTIYMLADGKIVARHSGICAADQKFVAGVLGFNRTMEAKNAVVTTGTEQEITALIGVSHDAKLDGVADDDIWTDEVLGNALRFGYSETDPNYFDLAAVKGTDGVYFLATIYHKQALTTPAQGDGTQWFHWLNIEFRFGNDGNTQRCIYFENGLANGLNWVVTGSAVTKKQEDSDVNKTTVEFFAPYSQFVGFTAASDEIKVRIGGWVVEKGYRGINTDAFVSTHGLRYTHAISVNGNATVTGFPTRAAKGDEISFKVAVEEGLTIKSVKVGETVLTAVEGVYTFTMPDADVTIVVEIDGRRNVDMSAVEGKVQLVGTPDQGAQIEFKSVAPWAISKLKINGTEVSATEGKYVYTVGTENLVVTADFIVVTDDITIDGKLGEGEDYGTAQSFKVEGGRDVTFYAKKTSHGLVMYLVAHTTTDVTTAADWYLNHNFEFYINNGDQRYVNSKNQSSGVTAFARSATKLVDGKYDGMYEHVYEVFVEGKFESNVRINYAFKAPGEAVRYEGLSNPTWGRTDWWTPVVGGCDANINGLYGKPGGRPENLFITETGLLSTRPVAQYATIDADFSEYEDLTSVTKGNEDAKFIVTGKVAADGYYIAISILQKQTAESTPEWHLNDNVEMDLFTGDFSAPIGFSIFEDFICAHGAIAQQAMKRTAIDQDGYKVQTDVELFIAYDSPRDLVTFNMGRNGNGFGGWQELAWGSPANRVVLTASGASNYNKADLCKSDSVTLDGNLGEDFWSGVAAYNNVNSSSYSDAGVYALIQAKKGTKGVYIAVTMYHNKATTEVVQNAGNDWWHFLNVEFHLGGTWGDTPQRAASVWNNTAINCEFGWTTAENTETVEEGKTYAHKTVFEIFVDYDWTSGVTAENDTTLLIACVAEKGWYWLLNFDNASDANTITSEGLARK